MFYYIYVLFSREDKGIYTGFTNDLKRRIKEHNQGNVDSAKNRQLLDLIYFEGYKSKKAACQRERYLKTGWGRNYLNKIIGDFLENNPKI
ncbi:GIY-YIG nuclease family protein [Candidatus Wolfebacteria bacterium]|nr:GIY-YIG nuclease family protein [Candidatus Wolfebacteria bacterium]